MAITYPSSLNTGEPLTEVEIRSRQQLQIVFDPAPNHQPGVIRWTLGGADQTIPLTESQASGVEILPKTSDIETRPGFEEEVSGWVWIDTPGSCTFWLDFTVTVAGKETKRRLGPVTCIH